MPTPLAPGTSDAEPATNKVRSAAVPSAGDARRDRARAAACRSPTLSAVTDDLERHTDAIGRLPAAAAPEQLVATASGTGDRLSADGRALPAMAEQFRPAPLQLAAKAFRQADDRAPPRAPAFHRVGSAAAVGDLEIAAAPSSCRPSAELRDVVPEGPGIDQAPSAGRR